jgi:hypothetical protein
MKRALLTALVLAAPRAALACPVCFGQSDSPMAIATNDGIFLMLGVVVLTLGAFASFIVYLVRRANRLAQSETERTASGYIVGEGTAQC